MDCQLDFVGGETKGQPGRVSHQERTVELSGEGVEVRGEGSRQSGKVGDEESDRAAVVDFGCDYKRESAFCIP